MVDCGCEHPRDHPSTSGPRGVCCHLSTIRSDTVSRGPGGRDGFRRSAKSELRAGSRSCDAPLRLGPPDGLVPKTKLAFTHSRTRTAKADTPSEGNGGRTVIRPPRQRRALPACWPSRAGEPERASRGGSASGYPPWRTRVCGSRPSPGRWSRRTSSRPSGPSSSRRIPSPPRPSPPGSEAHGRACPTLGCPGGAWLSGRSLPPAPAAAPALSLARGPYLNHDPVKSLH